MFGNVGKNREVLSLLMVRDFNRCGRRILNQEITEGGRSMSILWKYLDKTNAAIEALKDYGSMQFIIESTDTRIKQEQSKMEFLQHLVDLLQMHSVLIWE